MSYNQRLGYFNLERLELRRIHFDLIELYKIVNQYTVSNLHNAMQFCCHATITHVVIALNLLSIVLVQLCLKIIS
jgi:hypothetical protein